MDGVREERRPRQTLGELQRLKVHRREFSSQSRWWKGKRMRCTGAKQNECFLCRNVRGGAKLLSIQRRRISKQDRPACPSAKCDMYVSQIQEDGTNRDGACYFRLWGSGPPWRCCLSVSANGNGLFGFSPLWEFLWSKLYKQNLYFPMKVKKMCTLGRPLLFLELTSALWTPQLTCGGVTLSRGWQNNVALSAGRLAVLCIIGLVYRWKANGSFSVL